MGLLNESVRYCGHGSARRSTDFRKKETVKLLLTPEVMLTHLSIMTMGIQLTVYLYLKLTFCSQFLDFYIPFVSFKSSQQIADSDLLWVHANPSPSNNCASLFKLSCWTLGSKFLTNTQTVKQLMGSDWRKQLCQHCPYIYQMLLCSSEMFVTGILITIFFVKMLYNRCQCFLSIEFGITTPVDCLC